MARYAHLPMYKPAMDLTVYLEQVVPGWPTFVSGEVQTGTVAVREFT